MTMEPRILSRFSSSRIDSTATWSEYFRFPYPMVRAAAMAAFSVTRRNPISRLDSMKFLRKFDRAHSSRKLVLLAMLAVAATAYLAVLLKYNCYFAAGPDSAGYCTEAKMIASGHMMMEVPLLRELQLPPDMIRTITPIGWMRGPVDGFMVPTYPAGVPFHQALLGKLFGWGRAPFVLAPILAFLTVFACAALFCEFGVPLPYACAGAAIYVLIPSFVNHAM